MSSPEVPSPNLEIAQAVARLRALLQASCEVFGGFQWSNAGLHKVCIAYHEVIQRCVGIEEPSPFKRSAAIALAFMSNYPMYGAFRAHPLKEKVAHIEKSMGAILIFEYVRSSLSGATIEKTTGEIAVLENRIKVSEHTMIDIVHALSHAGSNGVACFHFLALLFEQLAYIDNPEASYPRNY